MFLNSLLLWLITTVLWSGATSICDGFIISQISKNKWKITTGANWFWTLLLMQIQVTHHFQFVKCSILSISVSSEAKAGDPINHVQQQHGIWRQRQTTGEAARWLWHTPFILSPLKLQRLCGGVFAQTENTFILIYVHKHLLQQIICIDSSNCWLV